MQLFTSCDIWLTLANVIWINVKFSVIEFDDLQWIIHVFRLWWSFDEKLFWRRWGTMIAEVRHLTSLNLLPERDPRINYGSYNLHVCVLSLVMHTHAQARTHTYTHIHVYVHVYTYTHTCTCTYYIVGHNFLSKFTCQCALLMPCTSYRLINMLYIDTIHF